MVPPARREDRVVSRFSRLVSLCALLLALPLTASAAPPGACVLLDAGAVADIIGLAVVNVVERDRGSFASCSFETDDWTQTVGLLRFPGLRAKPADALAAEIRADLDRDGVEYVDFSVEPGFDAAAVYYRSPEGDLHVMVIQAEDDRLILSASSREAALELARLALGAIQR